MKTLKLHELLYNYTEDQRIKVIVYNPHMSFVRRGMLVFEGGGRDPISI